MNVEYIAKMYGGKYFRIFFLFFFSPLSLFVFYFPGVKDLPISSLENSAQHRANIVSVPLAINLCDQEDL